MWNLIMSSDNTAWESDQRLEMTRSRFGEHSGDEYAAVDLANPESRKFLEQIHTVLMYEKGTDDPPGEIVRVGHLRDIQADLNGHVLRDITFRFKEIGRTTRTWVHENAHRMGVDDWELNRTHWAVKDGELPQDMLRDLEATPAQYDVVVSFAGEQREYVEAFVGRLTDRGLEVFYDKLEEATLWGKDLGEHFQRVYRDQGRFCVMFISEQYAEKVWTRHERRSALERALHDRQEYILPVQGDRPNDADLGSRERPSNGG
jgi:hypothetical protein